MRITLAGASGVIGRRLLPRLLQEGHAVTGLTRHEDRAGAIRSAGAEAEVCNVFNRDRLIEIVAASKPDIVVQQLTDLPPALDPRRLEEAYRGNDRVRTEGTANLVAAAAEAGAGRYLAQNVCFGYAPVGGAVKTEDDPLFAGAPPPFDRTARAYRELEDAVLTNPAFDGLVLRFGFWYGPGTSFARDGFTAREVRKRRYPIVGRGTGVFSFIHVDDAVEATIAALERGAPGAYNVCDDEPAPVREWLPAYAAALGARPPRRVPAWLARLFVGGFGASMMTDLRGASNAKAKRELGWTPRYPSWREGFVRDLG